MIAGQNVQLDFTLRPPNSRLAPWYNRSRRAGSRYDAHRSSAVRNLAEVESLPVSSRSRSI